MKKLCLLAVPSGVESFSYNMSQMCILGIVNSFGTMVTVTKGYCSIFANLAYVYAMAIASATQIVLGYLIGAKKIDLSPEKSECDAEGGSGGLCGPGGSAVLGQQLYLSDIHG